MVYVWRPDQTEYWGIWMFALSHVDRATQRLVFSRGGWQEARGGSIGGAGGRGHAQDYFVEVLPEPLDVSSYYYS